jgi:outer membrane protein assembly factor BamA
MQSAVRYIAGPVFLLLLLIFNLSISGQEMTRAEEFESLRIKKSSNLQPPERNAVERGILWVQERKILEKLETPGAGWKGIRPKMGGLSTGSGFGFGFQYDKVRMLDNQLNFSMTGAASPKWYQLYELKLDMPRLAGEHAFLTTTARHRAMPQEDYFGLGPDSDRANRTNYLFEDTSLGIKGGVRPVSWLSAGASVDWVKLNVGKGTDPRFASTELVFTDSNTPGLDRQPDFLQYGWSVAIDTRDSIGNPHRGGFYGVAQSHWDDRSFDEFDFRRFEVELQQYVPFNAGHRVIAARLRASFDDPRAGQRVPFYLQKTLGGSNDLRGFREFRFRDENQVLLNLEYRWEAWSGLDMAIFGDAGKVFASRREFEIGDMETSYGIGFRFNTVKNVFWRIDIARSREGTRTFIKFEHVF